MKQSENVEKQPKKRKRKRKWIKKSREQEFREIEELMGVNQPRYERRNHAVRRKGR